MRNIKNQSKYVEKEGNTRKINENYLYGVNKWIKVNEEKVVEDEFAQDSIGARLKCT